MSGALPRDVTAGLHDHQPTVQTDERGFFVETFHADALHEAGIRETWVQDNRARSQRGVLPGMHFSIGEGQAKLVRCVRGTIFDVAVDIRRGAPTYGRWEAVTLDDESLRMVLPAGRLRARLRRS